MLRSHSPAPLCSEMINRILCSCWMLLLEDRVPEQSRLGTRNIYGNVTNTAQVVVFVSDFFRILSDILVLLYIFGMKFFIHYSLSRQLKL